MLSFVHSRVPITTGTSGFVRRTTGVNGPPSKVECRNQTRGDLKMRRR